MSDYGVFEASSTDGHEEEQRQRQATRDLGRAIEAAREGFGDFLGAATDKDDYKDRLALVMNDLMQKVADSGVMPVPGVMRKVKAALRPEFRKQAGFTGGGEEVDLSDPSSLSDEDLIYWASSAGGSYISDSESDAIDAEVKARGLEQHVRDIQTYKVDWTPPDKYNYFGNRKALHKQAAETFQPGDKVMKSGYPGTVQGEYMDGMYEVRMERGTVVVPAEELTRVSSRRTASIDELQSYVESKGVPTTPVGTGFEFPLPTGADGEIFVNRNGDFVVQTLVSGGGGISSLYTKDEVAVVKGWIDASLSGRAARKQASAYLPVVSVEQNTGDSYTAELVGGFAFEAYDEGGTWVWSIFDNSGEEVASDETFSLDAAKDDAAYALERVASRKRAFSEQLGVHLTEVFESGEAGGGWRPITGERLDWAKGDLEFYGGSGFFRDWSLEEENGDPDVFGFSTNDDSVIIDAAWRAVDYANGIRASRKQALELGEWEEDLPGLGYAKATKVPGGGWEVYIWDEAGQNETLTPVNSSEEARRLFYDTIKSYPGSGYDHIDF